MTVKAPGEADDDPGRMSLNSAVPTSVPSLRHSSRPARSFAVKKRAPSKAMRFAGLLVLLPGAMSFTSIVPASVPSLFHSSMVLAGSKAVKNNVPAD